MMEIENLFLFSSVSAVAFKNAKQFEQAKDACLKEAVAHENNRAYLFNLWKLLMNLLPVGYSAVSLEAS